MGNSSVMDMTFSSQNVTSPGVQTKENINLYIFSFFCRELLIYLNIYIFIKSHFSVVAKLPLCFLELGQNHQVASTISKWAQLPPFSAHSHPASPQKSP